MYKNKIGMGVLLFLLTTSIFGSGIYEKDGLVGIGTTDPAGKLHVDGSVLSHLLRLKDDLGSHTGEIGTKISDDGGRQFFIRNTITGDRHSLLFQTGGQNTRMVVKGNGNVGIGTTNPEAPFQVGSNTTAGYMRFKTPNSDYTIGASSAAKEFWIQDKKDTVNPSLRS